MHVKQQKSMRALINFGLVILAGTLLLHNPAVLCALMTQTQPPAHHCCPKSTSPQQDCAQPHCDGINATTTATADLQATILPAASAHLPVLELQPPPLLTPETLLVPLAHHRSATQLRI